MTNLGSMDACMQASADKKRCSCAPQSEILLLREGFLESVVSDLISFCVAVSMIGIGVYLQSSAMQWFGFLITVVYLFHGAKSVTCGKQTYTPQEAADYLLKQHGVSAGVGHE